MQAVILAGGKGTRLKPYTTVLPKPLMPIGDYPILEVLLRQLKYFGVTDITMAVGHLKELIQAFFSDGSNWDLNIKYSFENKPLGTAAPLKLISELDDDFLVMNGDVLTDLDFKEFFEYHKSSGALCSIAMYKKPVKIDLGVLDVDNKNKLIGYTEKPTLNYNVSMGVYAFSKKVIEYIPNDQYFDFPELMLKLMEMGQNVQCYPFNGYWLDIGRPDDYDIAIEQFNNNIDKFIRN
ncbi:MAG: NTP transferase domain-containing protein [Candidatus Delongbacteria bacterium]|nr:NTP transferase domain-containing protein [Candidatus Delongbacteria bacterium]